MYVNISRDLLGIDPREGTTFQASSFGRRGKTGSGVAGRFQEKCLDLAPGETFTMADLDGPGVITRIWVTVPRKINPGVLRNVVLKACFDGEDEPSVQTPLGDLFGTTFARPRQYASAYTAITSGAYLCFFPMPFRRQAVLTLENQGRLPARLFFYQVTWLRLERELPDDTPYFHCSWHRESCSRNGAPYTVLDARGRGFYLGCHLDMQGKGWPWRLNPARISMPEGYGMGVLEGWETMRIDGAALPNVHGTGGEDYFNGAWYFTRVPSTWLTHGVTERRYDTRRVSCYRFHVEMPVCFPREHRGDHRPRPGQPAPRRHRRDDLLVPGGAAPALRSPAARAGETPRPDRSQPADHGRPPRRPRRRRACAAGLSLKKKCSD